MPERPRGSGGSRQPDLFARSKQPKISLPDNHPMVVLTDTVDWTEMEVRAEKIRAKKLKNAAGRPPQLRATLGALTLMALRRLPYREVEEQIRYYAPARYLCGLTETDWTPDFTTIQDFAQLMGEDGVKLINEGVVEQAVKLGLADAKVVVADLTAQEAAIPHPNEMGLLGGFVRSLEAAASKAGQVFKGFLAKAGGKLKAAKDQVRKYRLFAKDKTKAAKDDMVAQMASIVEGINQELGKVLAAAADEGRKLRGHAVVARRKLGEWHETIGKLVPQIRHWLDTGFVAAGKIINLHIPELYSIVRGKVGKSVEFGLSWGSHGCAADSSLRPWPAPRRTSAMRPSLSRRWSRSWRCSARRHVLTLTTEPGTANGTSTAFARSACATWDWPPGATRLGKWRER